MRFLKNKIRLVHEANARHHSKSEASNSPNTDIEIHDVQQEYNSSLSPQPSSAQRPRRACAQRPAQVVDTKFANPTKNIIINYGKAIASFASSDLAAPYLQPYLRGEDGDLKEKFKKFINQAKSRIAGNESLQSLLKSNEKDCPETILFKEIFQRLGEVFIKYFSVNWIIHGRVTHKLVYLKYRGIMLRKILNPENFIFVKKTQTD